MKRLGPAGWGGVHLHEVGTAIQPGGYLGRDLSGPGSPAAGEALIALEDGSQSPFGISQALPGRRGSGLGSFTPGFKIVGGGGHGQGEGAAHRHVLAIARNSASAGQCSVRCRSAGRYRPRSGHWLFRSNLKNLVLAWIRSYVWKAPDASFC